MLLILWCNYFVNWKNVVDLWDYWHCLIDNDDEIDKHADEHDYDDDDDNDIGDPGRGPSSLGKTRNRMRVAIESGKGMKVKVLK